MKQIQSFYETDLQTKVLIEELKKKPDFKKHLRGNMIL